MGLALTKLEFSDFRNYRHLRLDGLGPLTVFVGPNAAGKTNIVEGIQLLTAQSSFRNPTVSQMVREGAPCARLDAWAQDGSRDLQLTVQMEAGRTRRLLNGKAKRAADLRGIVPSVAFTPDDLDLARSASSVKRDAVDALGSQLSASHHRLRADYEKALRGKNRLLKDEAPDALLDSADEVLVMVGAQLTCYRAALFARLAEAMAESYGRIAGGCERLSASYAPSWAEHDPARFAPCPPPSRDEARERMWHALAVRRAEERARHRAVVGPHADHLDFFIDGRNAAVFGSQGQKRSLVLAFKLAETALIEDMLDQKPVLLLDDVMGELDARRRAALMQAVAGDLQTFITATNLDYFDAELLSAARVLQVPFAEENAETRPQTAVDEEIVKKADDRRS